MNIKHVLYSCAWNVNRKRASLVRAICSLSLACSLLAKSMLCRCCFSKKMATKTKGEHTRWRERNGGKAFALHHTSPRSACLGAYELVWCHHDAIRFCWNWWESPSRGSWIIKIMTMIFIAWGMWKVHQLPGHPLSWFIHLVRGEYIWVP